MGESATDLLEPSGPKVRLVRWPEERELLEQLRAERAPRLLLVGAQVPAPVVEQCDEDWVRLPADDADVRARVAALRARAGRHRPGPQLAADGRLRYEGDWIALSPIEHRLARALAERFGEVVDSGFLTRAAWPGNGDGDRDGNDGALRVHLTRLRRRLRHLALDVQNVRGHGYVMEHLRR